MNVLPLSMSFELHDQLLLNSVENRNYDLELNYLPQGKGSIPSQNQQLELKTNRLRKTDENFWNNRQNCIKIQKFLNTEIAIRKRIVTKLYTEYFLRSYNALEPFTWRILYSCGNCILYQKLKPFAR